MPIQKEFRVIIGRKGQREFTYSMDVKAKSKFLAGMIAIKEICKEHDFKTENYNVKDMWRID